MRRYPLDFKLASGGAANGPSALEVVAFCTGKTVQIGGTFEASVAIEGRLSQTFAWAPLTTLTAPGIYEVTATVYDLRINVSGYVSGTVTAAFAGFNAQPG